MKKRRKKKMLKWAKPVLVELGNVKKASFGLIIGCGSGSGLILIPAPDPEPFPIPIKPR